MTKEERKENFRLQCIAELKDETILDQKEHVIMLEDFIDYWVESSDWDKKLRFEKERTFGIRRRFATWKRNHEKWNKPKDKTSFFEQAFNKFNNASNQIS